MRVLMAGMAAALLAGCGGGGEALPANDAIEENVSTLAGGPMLGPVDLSQPVRAFGNDPYWMVDLAPGTIYYFDHAGDAPEPQQLYFVAPELTGDSAVYTTQNTEGTPAVLTLTVEPCTEAGTPENALPLTAQLRLGEVLLRGCAGQGLEDAEADPTAANETAAE